MPKKHQNVTLRITEYEFAPAHFQEREGFKVLPLTSQHGLLFPIFCEASKT